MSGFFPVFRHFYVNYTGNQKKLSRGQKCTNNFSCHFFNCSNISGRKIIFCLQTEKTINTSLKPIYITRYAHNLKVMAIFLTFNENYQTNLQSIRQYSNYVKVYFNGYAIVYAYKILCNKFYIFVYIYIYVSHNILVN